MRMSGGLIVVILFILPPSCCRRRRRVDSVVISQVYSGGGNAGAAFRNDYVELVNAGSATSTSRAGQCSTPRPLERRGRRPPSRERSRRAAFTWSSLRRTPTSAPFSDADATGTSNLGAASGKIALVPVPPHSRVAPRRELLRARRGSSRLRRYQRFRGLRLRCGAFQHHGRGSRGRGCTDTNDNTADFTAATPAPRNSASPAHVCAGAPSSGPSGSVNIDLDVASVLTVSLDRSSLSFGTSRPAIGRHRSPSG